MKTNELKKMIKDAVREAIQEEFKDILLEAVRTTKMNPQPSPVMENQTSPQQQTPPGNIMTGEDKREAYKNILGDTAKAFTSQNVPGQFNPPPGSDSLNGSLPSGEVGMGQIMGLLKT